MGIARNSSEKWGLQIGVEASINVAVRFHTGKADEANKEFNKSWSAGGSVHWLYGGGMEYEKDAGGGSTTSVKFGFGAGATVGPKWTFSGEARTDGYVHRW